MKMHKTENGAPGRTRTSTPVRTADFESTASTNSATGALTGENRASSGAMIGRTTLRSKGKSA